MKQGFATLPGGGVNPLRGHDMSYGSPEEIFNEMASLTKSYQGMTYDRIGIDGLQKLKIAPDRCCAVRGVGIRNLPQPSSPATAQNVAVQQCLGQRRK
ncbi:MAG: hypothetical protein JEZ12_16280 [Desulfobacterium sp.]|nr:hypothetical protein [Desulfobacterium sp.]